MQVSSQPVPYRRQNSYSGNMSNFSMLLRYQKAFINNTHLLSYGNVDLHKDILFVLFCFLFRFILCFVFVLFLFFLSFCLVLSFVLFFCHLCQSECLVSKIIIIFYKCLSFLLSLLVFTFCFIFLPSSFFAENPSECTAGAAEGRGSATGQSLRHGHDP